MEHPLGQGQILPGGDLEKILDEAAVMSAGAGACLEELGGVEEQNLRLLRGRYRHQQGLSGDAGVGLREDLPCPHVGEDTPIAPGVIGLDVGTAGENQSQILDCLPHVVHRLLAAVPPGIGTHTPQHGLRLLRVGAMKEGRGTQKWKIHNILHLLF